MRIAAGGYHSVPHPVFHPASHPVASHPTASHLAQSHPASMMSSVQRYNAYHRGMGRGPGVSSSSQQRAAHTTAPKTQEPSHFISPAQRYNAYHKGLNATSSYGDTVQISEEAKQKSVQASALGAIGTIGAIMVGISSANQAIRNEIRHVAKDTPVGQFAVGALSSTEENMSGGLIKAPTPEKQTKAYEVGKAVGDVIGGIGAILGGPELGGIKVVGGAARELTASASGLAISGRAVASSGVAVTAGRAAVVARSAHNFGKDIHQLSKIKGTNSVAPKGRTSGIPGTHPWKELPTSGEHPFVPPTDKGGNPIVKKGPRKGLVDNKNNEWNMDKGAAAHNPHWDVRHPNGSHTNVNPQSSKNPGSVNHGPNNFRRR